jgi:outer membrane lipoprotein SlyB
MRMATLKGATLAAFGAAALAACAPQPSGDVVSANQAQTAQSVQFGTVISARNVTVQGSQGAQAAGAVVGGIAGAALGQNVGKGTGQVLATGAGATAGAAAGLQAGRAAGSRQSIEWTVQLESGQTITVIQASPTFSVGQRVQVIGGGTNTRLAAA